MAKIEFAFKNHNSTTDLELNNLVLTDDKEYFKKLQAKVETVLFYEPIVDETTSMQPIYIIGWK